MSWMGNVRFDQTTFEKRGFYFYPALHNAHCTRTSFCHVDEVDVDPNFTQVLCFGHGLLLGVVIAGVRLVLVGEEEHAPPSSPHLDV